MRTIQDEFDELADDFDALGTWESQLTYVIDLGKSLAPLAEWERSDANKVRGCAAQVWLVTRRLADGRLEFRADSDAPLVRGLIALIVRLVSGHTPSEITTFDLSAAFDRLGLPKLSMTRANGLASMAAKVRQEALAAG